MLKFLCSYLGLSQGFWFCFAVVIVSLVWVITNGFVSLSSFSVCLSLIYRKATDASILILYPVTLLKTCIISRSFLLKSVEPFKYRITLTSNRDTFIFYLIHFIFSSSAINLVKNNHHIKQMWKDWKSLSYPWSKQENFESLPTERSIKYRFIHIDLIGQLLLFLAFSELLPWGY